MMTTTNQTLETLSFDQLVPVTGGGIGSTIGGLFGAKGQQWGALADNVLGMFGGGGGLGGIFGKLLGGGGSSGGSSGSSGGGSSGGGAPAADASGGGAQ
jgi:FAD/FMN-containing dehydrogenase